MRKRATSGWLRLVIRAGRNSRLEMISRSGSATLETGIDSWPLASRIAPGGLPGGTDGGGEVGAAATAAVALDVAVVEPAPLDAVTSMRSAWPTSPAPSVYVCDVVPVALQLLPPESQSSHR